MEFFVTAAPERIELTQAEKAELISRIKSNRLTEDDRDIFVGLIEFTIGYKYKYKYKLQIKHIYP